MNKPREFWVDDLTLKCCGPWEEIKDIPWPDNEKVLHVIDIEEYQKLQQEIVKLKDQNRKIEDAIENEIEQRDFWEERATNIAVAVGDYFGIDVGEHTSNNCPIEEAKKILNGEYETEQDIRENAMKNHLNCNDYECSLLVGKLIRPENKCPCKRWTLKE